MGLLIKGAHVVDYSRDFIGDIYIEDGVINEIGISLNKDCETINVEGYVIMPAFTDLHCHFRDPGFTYKEDIITGSRAAINGGYTTVNLMANTKPVCSDMGTVKYVLKKSKEADLIDIHQTVSITNNLEGTDLSHLDALNKDEKLVKFISDDGKGVGDSKIMLQAMLKANEMDVTIMSHAENAELSNIDMRLAENLMTFRDISLAEYTNSRLHMSHVSTKESIEYIIAAKKRGVKVTCEVAPHHLALTEEVKFRVNPPLRKQEDINSLVAAINEGFVDAIATDHAPHSAEDKAKGSPGMVGIETAFAVCYTALVKTGKITLNKLSELMSKGPADIMGINKGKISIGVEADLVLIDLNKQYEINSEKFHSKGKNSPFIGHQVYGEILKTIKAGKIINL